jgi:hypothetical protein
MELSRQHDLPSPIGTSQPLIAYVYGDVPPDFAAIAACGFTVVCVDTSAPWFNDRTLAEARAHDLIGVAFRMSYEGGG